ncbi:MAG TPA: hypothetical protein VLB80_01735 [Candidatus Babeliales bacterium]|nr:hypothetical protein [Candidatus Babeliales bacterium]
MINKQIISFILATTFTFSYATSTENNSKNFAHITLYKKIIIEHPKKVSFSMSAIISGLVTYSLGANIENFNVTMLCGCVEIGIGLAILCGIFSEMNNAETVNIPNVTNNQKNRL